MEMRTGVTFVEILAVIVLLGAAASMVVGVASRAPLVEASRSVARHIVAERLAAVLEGGFVCMTGLDDDEHVARVPMRGLAFGPDGLPRTCDGGGVGNTTILLEHRGRQAAVIVSSLGRVRWELR